MIKTRLGPLNCTVIGEGKPQKLLILCHGYGAPGNDLVSIGSALVRRYGLGDSVRIIFPEAPLSLPDSYGGRCWWQLDAERYAVRAARGDLDGIMDETPDGLSTARRQLKACVEEALHQADLGYAQLHIGGFSQGAMVTTDLALRLEEAPASLTIMSGALICRPEWARKAAGRAGLRVLQSHGRGDMLLPMPLALSLRGLLEDAGLNVEFIEFSGGHGVPPEVIEALASLISD